MGVIAAHGGGRSRASSPPLRSILLALDEALRDKTRAAVRTIRELSERAAPLEPLCRLIDRLHAKKPADRPAKALEVADLLARLLAGLQGQGRSDFRLQIADFRFQSAICNLQSAIFRLSRPRLWAAAALVLLFAGLGLGEATGVTDVRGTVVRLVSPAGTLVVEVDDPGVSVTVDGADVIITGAGAKEIRLKPGQYKVEASRDGKVVRQELVTVARSGRQVVRVSAEDEPLTAAGVWEKSVAALPAEEQVKAVEQRLRELNPELRGKIDSTIKDGVVLSVGFIADRVSDISPLRALRGLTSVNCSGPNPRRGSLSDLGPLRGLRLHHLDCSYTQVTDLEPIRGMPLKRLHCQGTGVADLSPAEGMGLEYLTLQETPMLSLRPLRGMPLRWLDLFRSRITDLSPLAGMPLEYLNLTALPVTTLAPLADLKTLRWLVLDDTAILDLGPLRGLRLNELGLARTAATDLTPAAGMPLRRLRLDYRPDREAFVRSFPGLELINDKPAAEFWKEVGRK